MIRLTKYVMILVTLAICVSWVHSQQADTMTFEQVTLPETEVRYIESSIINEEIKIYVLLPDGYASTEKTYPVLYLTDANLMFAATYQIIRMMQVGGELPQLILVGLGYRTDSWYKVFSLRSRDLTPTPIPDPQNLGWATGEAPQFLRLIKEEVFPFIKENYRVSEDAGYVGYSYGGLFGAYVLFHHPEMFQRYIIGSPSLWFDNLVTFKYEAEYAAKHSDLPARVFMSIGELEKRAYTETDTTTNVKQLQNLLQSRHYPSLHLQTMVLKGETHLSGFATAISHGLREIYKE
jgi:predicted alpha/beta superfamily hydrolase